MNPVQKLVSLSIAVLYLATPAIAVACPTCKSALHNGAGIGFAIAIMFMMSMPFLIVAFWTVTIFRFQKAKTLEQKNGSDTPR